MRTGHLADSRTSPKGEIPAAKKHGEPVLLGPTIDGPSPGTDHPLRIGENEQFLAFQRVKAVNHPGLDHALLFGSGREPILQPETGDVLEVGRVVCHHGEVMHEGGRADHEVHRANHNAPPQQAPAGFS